MAVAVTVSPDQDDGVVVLPVCVAYVNVEVAVIGVPLALLPQDAVTV